MKLPVMPVRSAQDATRNFDALLAQQPKAVSELPSFPADGAEVLFQNATMATLGVLWHLRYRAASESTHKWEFVGGSPLYAEEPAQVSSSSTSLVELGSGTPAVTTPLAGDYEIEIRANQLNSGGGGVPARNVTSVKLGAGAAEDGDGTWSSFSNGAVWYGSTRVMVRTGILAGQKLVLVYRVDKGEGKWQERAILIRPIRVG